MLESLDGITGMSPPRGSGSKVLIVEDDSLIALTIEDVVRDFGVGDVRIASNAGSARQAVCQDHFDCAILDILVGAEETYDIADALAQRSIPFLFCSAFTREQVAERHRNRPWLDKPYRDEDLVAWLASHLRMPLAASA